MGLFREKPKPTPSIEQRLAGIERTQARIEGHIVALLNLHRSTLKEMQKMVDATEQAASFTAALIQRLQTMEDLEASMIAAMTGLSQQVRAKMGDPEAQKAILDRFDADNQKIAAAIAAGTPADPTGALKTDAGAAAQQQPPAGASAQPQDSTSTQAAATSSGATGDPAAKTA